MPSRRRPDFIQYADHGAAGSYFVTLVDNHDQMARSYRRFLHNHPYPRQAVLAIGYLLTAHGVPCLYHGTEQGFDGGGPDDAYVYTTETAAPWHGDLELAAQGVRETDSQD